MDGSHSNSNQIDQSVDVTTMPHKFGVTDFLEVLWVGLTTGVIVFLHDLSRDFDDEAPIECWGWPRVFRMGIRAIARVGGSLLAGWTAASIAHALGNVGWELPAASLAAVMGWKFLDRVERLCVDELRRRFGG